MRAIEHVAQLLFKAVKRASVNHSDISQGDLIVVTGADDDITGIVSLVNTVDNDTSVSLITASGKKTLQVSSENFIHIIQRADMLNMRNHIDYERDLVDAPKDAHKYTDKDCCPTFSPDDADGKSELPASKLSMKKQKGGE